MVEHDGHVGQLLKKLDDLGVTQNTIVVYTSDNGAEVMTWPDGGATSFRGEKATNWEGGYRTPTLIRWPGVIRPGTVYNEPFSSLLFHAMNVQTMLDGEGTELAGLVAIRKEAIMIYATQ
jgi:arylsulfatase A-like enzyme